MSDIQAQRLTAAPLKDLTALQVHHLYKLRVDIFVHEQEIPYAEIEDVDADESTVHILLHGSDGRLLAAARLLPARAEGRDVAQFGRFVANPHARGTGAADAVLRAALAQAKSRWPGLPVYLTAQVPLTGYYARYGFTEVGEQFDDTGVPHQPMIRY